MFIPSRIADNRRLILQLLNVTCGREDLSASLQDLGTLKEDGYLLMVCCQGGQGSQRLCPEWFGQVVKVDPTAETAIALSHIQVILVYMNIFSSGITVFHFSILVSKEVILLLNKHCNQFFYYRKLKKLVMLNSVHVLSRQFCLYVEERIIIERRIKLFVCL